MVSKAVERHACCRRSALINHEPSCNQGFAVGDHVRKLFAEPPYTGFIRQFGNRRDNGLRCAYVDNGDPNRQRIFDLSKIEKVIE